MENPFGPELLDFLRDLTANNRREWFQANKHRYEEAVKDPAFRFISGFGDRLRGVSEHYEAIPRIVGGSLFRIHRDTRFSKDKTPYKTHVAMHFRHRSAGGDVHTPGFYLHIGLDMVFLGAGVWRPDGKSLTRIREHIVAHPDRWRRMREQLPTTLELRGESLKRAPRGFDADHPLIEDLKRKDFTVGVEEPPELCLADGFPDRAASAFADAAPLVAFLCEALDVDF